MSDTSQSKIKRFETANWMRDLLSDHFHEVDRAAREGKPKVAWCTAMGPVELLRALGFVVYFPENHAAMLGATRMASKTIPAANAIGYSPDICAYLTSDIGACLQKRTPLSDAYKGITSVPKPDVLIYSTNQCRDAQDWFQWHGRHWSCPVMGISSFRDLGDVTDVHVDAVSRQLVELVPALEEIAGTRLDMDRLREILHLSHDCAQRWKAVLETGRHKPTPMTFFDSTIHMAPAVVLRGTQVAIDYYDRLLAELQSRIDDGVAGVDGERHRLYWEGMPVWGRLRELATQFLDLQAAVVASTYANAWTFEAFDQPDPFDAMARAYTELFIVRSDPYKEAYIERMVKAYDVDGIIFHDAKTCQPASNCRHGMHVRLHQRVGVPSICLSGDMSDLRCYSDEQARTQIEAFIEQLDG